MQETACTRGTKRISDAALHMMNLGSTPVARIRSFLDVLREVAVNRTPRHTERGAFCATDARTAEVRSSHSFVRL